MEYVGIFFNGYEITFQPVRILNKLFLKNRSLPSSGSNVNLLARKCPSTKRVVILLLLNDT